MSSSLSNLATRLVSDLGYWGMGAGLVVDSMGVPIPSEVLIPLAVVAATRGRLALWAVILVAVVAQLAGAGCSYLVARHWGMGLINRFGRFLMMSPRHLGQSERVFARHGGWIVAAGRCVPVVRGFIGYPAGSAAMAPGRYLAWSAGGTIVWTGLLVAFGEALSTQLATIDEVFSRAGTVIVAAFLLVLLGAVGRARWRGRRRRRIPGGVDRPATRES